jgi:hypothetical protein
MDALFNQATGEYALDIPYEDTQIQSSITKGFGMVISILRDMK